MAIMRFRYIKVTLFHIFYYGKESSSLYRGLRYIERFLISRFYFRMQSGRAQIKRLEIVKPKIQNSR